MKKIVLLIALLGGNAHAADGVAAIGGRRQLFIDQKFVRDAVGIDWCMNPPRKAGPVLSGENSWEDGIVSGAGAVLEDRGKYRFWYTAMPASSRLIEDTQFRLCYAESADGVHWVKPDLGIYRWEGSTANNILMDTEVENGAVFLDPKAATEERYKIVARLPAPGPRHPGGQAPHGTGVYIYTSPDGLHWRLRPQRVFPFDPDTVRRGDEIYQYYCGYDYDHGAYPLLPEIRHRGGMFLAVQRLDGFVSLDAGSAGGHFVTGPVVFSGRRLLLNLDASATGQVEVELRDAGGQPLREYAFGESDPLYQNGTAKVVTWRRGNSDVSALAGKTVQLAFRLRSAKLYAFQFVE